MITEDYELCRVYGWPARRVDKIYLGTDRNIQESLDSVEEIVVHHTDGGGNWQGLKGWYKNPGDPAKQGLFHRHIGFTHFYIERGGDIYKAFPLTRWMHHSCSGAYDRKTIGIELFHKTGPFTEMQYESLARVIEDTLQHCSNIHRITGHDYNYMKYAGRAKGCPSSDFDWRRLQADLVRKDLFFTFKFDLEEAA